MTARFFAISCSVAVVTSNDVEKPDNHNCYDQRGEDWRHASECASAPPDAMHRSFGTLLHPYRYYARPAPSRQRTRAGISR